MILSFDKFERYEMPQVTLCNPNSRATEVDGKITITDTVGVLSNPKGMNLKLNFNAPHELSFDYYRHKSSDPIKQSFYDSIYEAIQTDRYIYLTDIGYFTIKNSTDSDEDNIDKKSISLKSCEENELATAEGLHLKKGTYYLHTDNNDGLIDLFLPKTAGWTIGFIDPSLLTKPYFVEDTEVDNGYNFLYTTVQDMFECIVESDIIKRTISVYSRVYYAEHHLTDIHIAKYNLLKHKVVEENDEDKYTALNVQGKDENLEIRTVNPTGKNVIYNFEPRYSWMSPALQQAIEKWQEKCESVEEEYLTLQQGYYTELGKLFNEEKDIEVLNGELEKLKETKDIAFTMADGDEKDQSLNNVNKAITAKQTEINSATSAYNAHKKTVNTTYEIPIAQINKDCALDITAIDINGNSIFTTDLLNELMTHIKPTDYVDEYMLVTDSMTYPQRFDKAKELMDRAQSQLVKISSGQKTYSIDTRSFLFNKHFKYFSEQLCAGAIIYVETKKDIMEQLHLTGIDINFDDKSTSFTLGNKYDRSDLKALYDEALGQNSKSFSELKYIAGIIEEQQKQLDYQRNWVADLRTLTLDNVLTSEDQAIEINNRGLIGRKRQLNEDGSWKNDENGNPLFELEQVKLINNILIFTKDNWNTASTAVGKIAVGYNSDGSVKYDYGMNGRVIIGELFLGNNLVLTGTSAGIKIKDKNGNNAFYADENGNLTLSGKIIAITGKIGGWNISGAKYGSSKTPRRIIFIGDSYGVGWCPEGTVKDGWSKILANSLGLADKDWKNYSEGGTGFVNKKFIEAKGVYYTFHNLLEDAYNENQSIANSITDVVVGGGFNDLYHTTDTDPSISDAIKEFDELAKTYFPNAKITLFGIGWCNGEPNNNTADWLTEDIAKNRLTQLYSDNTLYPYCKTLGWFYADIHHWSDYPDGLFSSDNFHPNEAGLNKIAEVMTTYLNGTGLGRLYSNPCGYSSDACGFYLSNVPNEWAIQLGEKNTDYSSVGGDGSMYRPFLVSQSGELWAANAHIIGNITATSGSIGGWNIVSNFLGKFSSTDPSQRFFLSQNGQASYTEASGDTQNWLMDLGGKFAVNTKGQMYATDATITGTINANSGSIGGWTIGDDYLYGGNKSNGGYMALYSPNNVPSGDGWIMAVNVNDTYPFVLTKNGKLTCTKGSIGGWEITENYFGTFSSTDTSKRYFLSQNGIYSYAEASGNSQNWLMDFGGKFAVNTNGKMYAIDAEITGKINASTGKIGGWQINSSRIVKETDDFSVYLHSPTTISETGGDGDVLVVIDKIKQTYPFALKSSGKLVATNAEITGTINAKSGNIGGWNISNNYLYAGKASDGSLVQLGLKSLWAAEEDAEWYSVVMAAQAWDSSFTGESGESDANVKNSISEYDSKYEILFDALKPCRYKYNHGTSDRFHTGFIAQEVVEAIKCADLTTQDFAGVVHLEEPNKNNCEWLLRRDEFVSLNTWQIQKLKSRVTDLENTVAELKTQIQTLAAG